MRLIDVDALPKGRVEWEDILNAPTVDAVEVVRCKDCRHYCYTAEFHGTFYCDKVKWLYPNEDHFCSYGERKEEE